MIERLGTKAISRLQGNVAYRNIALIYNPYAGGLQGAKSSRLLDAEKALGKYGAAVETIATDAPRSAGRLAARAIANGSDLIVVAGGDGTINEARGRRGRYGCAACHSACRYRQRPGL